jgi:indolepyruvate ferredoxin oxidoreductase beta subunit
MAATSLPDDPYNIIITGVGGQGNVLASRVLGQMLTGRGLRVTIGETFGASQRGGSVMSHLRVSAASVWSPQIPRTRGHLVVALEPSEAFRVLSVYGNPKIWTIWNTRPIHSVGVIAGEQTYPSPETIIQGIAELSERHWALDATEDAARLGNPILGNIMMIGALVAVAPLPLDREDFGRVIAKNLPPDKLEINLTAFDHGVAEVQRAQAGNA